MTDRRKIWVAEDLTDIIYDFEARCIMQKIRPPSKIKITELIARNIDKEKLWQNEFPNL